MSQQSFILSDGSNDVAVLNSSPSGTEYGIGVRIIGSSFTSTFPSTGMPAGFSDGTNMQGARVFDLDSGGGTQYVLGTNLRFTSSGGSVEAGTASNPLRIDPTGTTIQPVSGTVTANAGTGTFTISGTVTANQGGTWTVQPGNTQNTTAWLTQDAADGPVSPGTVASKSILIGGQFNTSLPTLANTQQAALQVDSSGRLLVGSIASALPTGANVIGAVTQSAGPWTQNITQFGSSNVVTGTGASGAGIPRVTVANDSNILATQSGTWTVQPGNTANTTPWLVTVSTALPTGSNTIGAVTQASGPWTQNITQFGGSAVVTGTGASGSGIPRVTVANDSNILATQSGTWTVAQGTAAALSGAWPIKLTDGTNTAPTMDAAARAGYMRITDGTNTLGTLSTTLHADPNGDRRTIHNNATVTSSGSTVLTWIGWAEWYLVINLKNAPTGTSPTIAFKIEVVDPIDQTTVIDSNATVTGVTHTTAGVESLQIADLPSDTIKISWTVTGASASWTGVNVTFCGHGAGNAIEGQAEDGYALHDGPVPVAGVDNSNLVHTLKVDSSGSLQVVVSNFPASATTGLSHGRVVGSSGVQAAIRATTYTEQSANFTGSIKSSSTSDTSAGTGARTVTIYYVDSTGATAGTETVTLNGTTAVNLVTTTKCFIEKMVVATVGSNGSNVGTITLFTGSGGTGTTVGTIAVGTIVSGTGDNQTLWAHHYVVTGKTASIGSVTAGTTGNQAGIIFLKKATPTVSNSVEVQLTDVLCLAASTSGIFRVPEFPITIDGPARITAYVVPSGSNTNYFSGFDYSEV